VFPDFSWGDICRLTPALCPGAGEDGDAHCPSAPARVKQNILENVGALTDIGERGKFTCADIQKFNFPILLRNYEKSPKLFGEFISAMRHCKPDIPARLIVPNAGHSMNRENPEFFNKVILDFLKQH